MNDSTLNEKTTGAPRGAPVVFSGTADFVSAEQLNAGRTIEKFVVFFLSDRCYGVAARAVAEVVRPLAVAVVPHSPAWLAGVANLRGEIVPVLDSRRILNDDETASAADATKYIVLRAKIFAAPVALPVDRLSEIVALGGEEFEAATEKSGDFIVAAIAHQTKVLHLIDAEAMLASIAVG